VLFTWNGILLILEVVRKALVVRLITLAILDSSSK